MRQHFAMRRQLLLSLSLMPLWAALGRAGETEGNLDIKVMTWNLLADGRSRGGFVVPLMGAADPSQVPRRLGADIDWDNVTEDSVAAISGDSLGHVGPVENVSIAEMLLDLQLFRKHVLQAAVHQLQGTFGACYSHDQQLWALGLCAREAIEEVLSIYEGQVPEGTPPQDVATSFKEPDYMHLELGAKCGAAVKEAMPRWSCGTIITEHEALASLEEEVNRYVRTMEIFNRKWGVALHFGPRSGASLLAWGATAEAEEQAQPPAGGDGDRRQRLVALVQQHDADILAFQELDHYRFLSDQLASKYTSVLPDDASAYSRAVPCREKVEDMSYAFVPKCKEAQRQGESDDEGSALFWRKDRFEALNITKSLFSGDTSLGGYVGILLKDLRAERRGARRLLWAFSTQLLGGEHHEAERVAQIVSMAEQTRPVPLLEETMDAHEAKAAEVAIVLCMDGGARLGRGTGQSKVDSPTYAQVEKKLQLVNYKVAEADEGPYVTVTTNSMMGLHALAPEMTGVHEMDRIDYVAFSSALRQRSPPDLPRYSREDPTEALKNLLPNQECPSNHLPVVLDIGFLIDGGPPSASSDIKSIILVVVCIFLTLFIGLAVMHFCKPPSPPDGGVRRDSGRTSGQALAQPLRVELTEVQDREAPADAEQ